MGSPSRPPSPSFAVDPSAFRVEIRVGYRRRLAREVRGIFRGEEERRDRGDDVGQRGGDR